MPDKTAIADVTYLDAVGQALMATASEPDESVDPDHDEGI